LLPFLTLAVQVSFWIRFEWQSESRYVAGMNQTFLRKAFGVRGGYQCVRTEYPPKGGMELTLAVKKIPPCPDCHSPEVVRKGGRYRHLKATPIGLMPVVLKAEVPQCQCKICGKTFEVSPPLPKPTYDTPGDWAIMSMP
jgi:hypothetical protein